MGLLQPGFAKELRALPLMTHSLFEQWGRTGRLVLQRRSQGRGWGRGVLSTQRSRHDTGKKRKESEVAQSCLTLCDPTDHSPPGSSVYGIFQARVLEWGAIAFSVGSQSSDSQIANREIQPRWYTL